MGIRRSRIVLAVLVAPLTLLAGCGVSFGASHGRVVQAATLTHAITVTSTVTVLSTAVVSSVTTDTKTATSTAVSTVTVYPTPLPTPQHRARVTPTPLAKTLPVSEATQVTLDLLASLLRDPSGHSSINELGPDMRTLVQQGQGETTLLNIPHLFVRYYAGAAVLRAGGRAATVQVQLTLQGGARVTRMVTLVPEGGSWKVVDVAPYGG
ncbi:MAG: hypothetical protein M1118_04855 [Chloroflexi bacterium]|nr:hypothetical protein [Chloroflexota bacterium]